MPNLFYFLFLPTCLYSFLFSNVAIAFFGNVAASEKVSPTSQAYSPQVMTFGAKCEDSVFFDQLRTQI